MDGFPQQQGRGESGTSEDLPDDISLFDLENIDFPKFQ